VRTSLLILSSFLILASCRVNYGFTGTSIDPEIKSVSIAYFDNFAPLAKPTLSQVFTEALKDRFLQQTNLSLVKEQGEIQFSGKITDYQTRPINIQSNETAALNRLTITVEVEFVNSKNDEKNFKQRFSRYEDYESSQNLSEVEDQLIELINEQLIQDIFNKAVSDW
jgi:hypothetical protein